MRSLIVVVRTIPGTERQLAVVQSLEFAKELDTMIEVQFEGITFHVLPTSTVESLLAQIKQRKGEA